MAELRPRPYKSPWSRWRPQKTPRTGKDTKISRSLRWMGAIYKEQWALYIRSRHAWEVGRRRNRASAYPPIRRLHCATTAPTESATAQERPFSAVFSPLQGPAHFQRLPAVSSVSCYFYAMGENDTPMGKNLSVNFITKRLLRLRPHKSPWSDRFLCRMYGENSPEFARISARFRRFYLLSAWTGPPGELS